MARVLLALLSQEEVTFTSDNSHYCYTSTVMWWLWFQRAAHINDGLSISNQAWGFLPAPDLSPGSKAGSAHPSTDKPHLISSRPWEQHQEQADACG